MFNPQPSNPAPAEANPGNLPTGTLTADAQVTHPTILQNGKKSSRYGSDIKVVSKNELKDERDYSEEEYGNFRRLYEDTLSEFVEGQLLIGKVLAITSKEVAVDIGFKSEGVIPIDEFTNP